MERPVDTLARLIIAVIKAKVYIFAFLLIMFIEFEAKEKARSQRPGLQKGKTGLVILHTASIRHLKT